MQLDYAADTDVGKVRAGNEDSLFAKPPLFAVADGMGGHQAGEIASAETLRVLSGLAEFKEPTADTITSLLRSAHETVARLSSELPMGAGTTLVGAALIHKDDSPYWYIFNIGDSRLYLMAKSGLHQVTVDHSLMQELLDSGNQNLVDIAYMVDRNVITKAVGAENSAPDIWEIPVVEGQVLLLCSDGLTNELSDQEIERILVSSIDAKDAAKRLVTAANEAGGRDNISVVVVRVKKV